MSIRRSVRGFSLIEALVALAVLGAVLLMGMGVVLQQARAEARLAAHVRALHAAETALERLRAGALPLASTRVDDFAPILVWIEVEAAGPPGLWAVEARATFPFQGAVRVRRLQTLVWRHPEG
jgi:prepilin-type N-terminal cleavage/methylation domain-containing protein